MASTTQIGILLALAAAPANAVTLCESDLRPRPESIPVVTIERCYGFTGYAKADFVVGVDGRPGPVDSLTVEVTPSTERNAACFRSYAQLVIAGLRFPRRDEACRFLQFKVTYKTEE